MAERGADRITLMRLSPQTRLDAEISLTAETALRARQAQIRTTGNYIDVRA